MKVDADGGAADDYEESWDDDADSLLVRVLFVPSCTALAGAVARSTRARLHVPCVAIYCKRCYGHASSPSATCARLRRASTVNG